MKQWRINRLEGQPVDTSHTNQDEVKVAMSVSNYNIVRARHNIKVVSSNMNDLTQPSAVATPSDLIISKVIQAKALLAEVKDIDQAKKVADIAKALEIYAKRQKVAGEAKQYAHEVAIEAETMLGEFLKQQPKAIGTRGIIQDGMTGAGGTKMEPPVKPTPTLAELGIDKKESSDSQFLATLKQEDPEVYQEVKTGKKTVQEVKKKKKSEKKKQKKKAKEKKAREALEHIGSWEVHQADIADLSFIKADSVDLIITDPPYPQEYLHVYSSLAKEAVRVLKPGGSCFVMVGQSYLPEVVQRLSESLNYHWTLAYLTPGGQAVQLFQRHVNTFWKPVLWFVKGTYDGKWLGDVCKSATNDNDKEHHHWGQSESGMADLIGRCSEGSQVILDPFCGAGTTGVVAVMMGRNFIGSDIDNDCVMKSINRLTEETCNAGS